MSANLLLPRCCATGGSVLVVAQQQLKSLMSGIRCLHADGNARRTTGVAPATADDADVKSYEEMPGPKPLPLLGNVWRFLPVIGEYAGIELDDFHRQLYEKYGPLVRFRGIPGRKESVFAYRPEDLEVVFRNEGPWPLRDGLHTMDFYRTVVRKDFYQDGGSVLTENGPKWLESRSKVNQPMMQPRISKRYTTQVNNIAQEFIDNIRTMRDANDELPPNFINELFKWALESIACVAMDTRLGCLQPNLAPDSEPQRIIDAVSTVFESLFQLEFGVPIWRLVPTPAWKELVAALDVFLEVSVKHVQATIDRTERRKKEGLEEEEGEPSVLERLLARTDAKSASIMAQDMVLGGVDTTSFATAMTMYMLSKNLDKQELLFGEIKRLLPHKDSPVTEENHEEMKFLKATFKECMRMLPIVGANTRQTTKEIKLSNYRVPKGVNVIMPNVIFRNKEDIYPQSNRFIPERWLKTRPSGDEAAGSAEDFDAVSHGKRHPFTFLPFGFGPRSCVGKRFAELEMEVLIAKMIRNFRLEYHYGEVKISSKLINMIKDPLTFKMVERKD